MEPTQRKALISARFGELFGQPPELWSRAPGRVDLMGSHTDYNLGYVMTMSIDRDTWIAARPCAERRLRVYSMNLDGGGEIELDRITPDAVAPWTNYIAGMAKILQAEGLPVGGLDLLVHSTIPFASGLSSSAAIEMAAGVIFQLAGGFRLDAVRMALLGQKAENQFVGVNCGILDQYSSALGQAGSSLLLDCRDLSSTLSPIAAGVQVVICDTRAKRSLAGSEYGERRAQCEEGARLLSRFDPRIRSLRDVSQELFRARRGTLPELVSRRCQFIIEENQRVLDLAQALAGGDRPRLRALFGASYAGARDLYQISVPAMDAMWEAMLAGPGSIAARQAGAGFGGCMVALVEKERVAEFCAAAAEDYRARTGIEPSVYPVSAAPPAGPLP